MNLVVPTSLAQYAEKCSLDMKNCCEKIEKERGDQLRKKPLVQRVAFFASKVLYYGGGGLALASFTIGIFYSYSFLLIGAAAIVAGIVGGIARNRFGTISEREALLISLFKNNPILKKKDQLPSADNLKAIRNGLKIDLANAKRMELPGLKDNAEIFFGLLGFDRLAYMYCIPTRLGTRIQQVRVIYAAFHLLEAIQHIVKGRFVEVTQNVDFIQDMMEDEDDAPAECKFPEELKQKVDLLAARMKKPSKELQAKVKQAVGKNYKVSDLDSVYKAIA
ncbi:MAG: hypothetical protein LLG04_17410 [Parachlamydia sp.]|nr:hypothetical protein [Parachlamydia sp.]